MTNSEVGRTLVLLCLDCGHEFVWSDKEQIWYKVNEFDTPKRCPRCRIAKRLKYSKDYRPEGAVRRDND